MRLANKVAVITGAGSGLGRVSSRLFAQEGAKVVITDISEERANETLKQVLSDGNEAIAVKADVRETLRALVATLARRGGAQLAEKAKTSTQALAATNWSARRKTLAAQIASNAQRRPIDPDWLALQVVDALPPNAILVDEGLTSSRYIPFLRANKGRYDYHGLASGGIGWGLPASVGVSLANPVRPVGCFS